MWSKLRTWTTLAVIALGVTGVATAAAKQCHPDLAGTRSISITGAVTSYGFANGGVVVNWTRSNACAGSAAWNFREHRAAKAGTGCTQLGAPIADASAKLCATSGDKVARVPRAPDGADVADRLVVSSRSTHRQLASWPLIDRPTRVALHGNLAVLSTAKRHAIYVLRISDGKIAMAGINGATGTDRPTIGPRGGS